MPNQNYYHSLINQINKRSVESTVSMLGITDRNLRTHLTEKLSDKLNETAFLADPVFECVFPWEKHNQRMEELSGSLLASSLIESMDGAGDHRFGKDWFPFKHQVTAWSALLDQSSKKSAVITSGTGSGKTECFMVPILNDLATEFHANNEPLIGIRALFIYPLNALINSQRERLRAWTQYYDDGVRFCLYNGNTEEIKHKDQGKFANEILTRKGIRSTPPPIMVTNATMLEYMLVRQIDSPIIEQSQGMLRWIVLDEAHTYIGSQAAELSLLLRRVLNTFGVKPENVRFVATSATIGDKDAVQKLTEYLSSLAGVDPSQIVIVGGKREIPELVASENNVDSVESLNQIDVGQIYSTERFMRLAGNEKALQLRKFLSMQPVPRTLSSLAEMVYGSKSEESIQHLLQLLDVASFTQCPGPSKTNPFLDSQAFLPVRAHLFHQVMSGLWGCVNKTCSHKRESNLDESWPFGYVFTQRRSKCECGSPVYELVFCTDCNQPHLLAVQTNDGRLIQFEKDSLDEFSLDVEQSEEEQDDEDRSVLEKVFLAPRENNELTFPVSINPDDLSIQGMGAETIEVNMIEANGGKVSCACCGFEKSPHPFRQSMLGTPFYISNTVPILLEACQESDQANERPARGRRLITFTDSRQGTARISTKIQQDSERDSIRGQVYKCCSDNKSNYVLTSEEKNNLETYESRIEKYKGQEELVAGFVELRDAILKKIENNNEIIPITWNDLVTKLQASPDISTWMFDYYSDINPEIFNQSTGSRTLAEMILLREFARRPKRQNSMETLGLVAITYPALNDVHEVPREWEKLNFTLQDWRDFLKVMLDFYIRENTVFDIPKDWVRWMGAKVYPKVVLRPDSEENTASTILKWPQVRGTRSNRLIRMICAAANIDITNQYNIDLLNKVLQSAWSTLTKDTKILKVQSNTLHYHLVRDQLAFKIINSAWVCPITHRLIDTTFREITPYLPFNSTNTTIHCRKVSIPVSDIDASAFISERQRLNAIRNWVSESAEVEELRSENLWTDISDRILEGGAFFRTAEHSAQQPPIRLQRYEELFKQGRLNVLSCSTTMEMGVDIGGISVVAMNNVPPHPANYLQRAGRAGRRGETQAVAFTICKDNPHERGVFVNPLWPFITSIPAPYIVLNSAQIVQRHVNSLLMAYFLKNIVLVQSDKSATNLTCEWFFVGVGDEAPFQTMCLWLESLLAGEFPAKLEQGMRSIIKDSVLATLSLSALSEKALEAMKGVANGWLPKYEQLKDQIKELEKISTNDPFKKKIEYDLKRYCSDYLLSELASKAFLPGYGFPTGVVTFDNYSIDDFKKNRYKLAQGERIDNLTRMKERPGRDISIAIREYAPGADVVIDGLVYRSAGILLNPFAPDEDFSQPVKMSSEWRCHQCGAIGQSTSSLFDSLCVECGEKLKIENVREFIEPLAFSVDFYSSPTTDISLQKYIPVQEPWITAGSELRALYNPQLGSFRSSSEGHIFHHSSGEHGKGFAICLRCGRAESMNKDGEYPANLQPGKAHKKLQGKAGADDAFCDGSQDQFAIKTNLHLGASSQTDVFELYLKDPKTRNYIVHKTNDSTLWTLAVALRQSLADIHGITADEIGYTVKPTALPGCSSASCIALFDHCGGGAGFSSSAPYHVRAMLLNARKYLECPSACDSACQSCLLGFDTRFHHGLLNRFAAIKFLDEIADQIEIPEDQKLFGESTGFCFNTLDTEILRRAEQGYKSITVFLQGDSTAWNMVSSGVKGRVISWTRRFEKVNIVVNSALEISSQQLKDQFSELKAIGAQLMQTSQSKVPLALVENGSDIIGFDSSENLNISIPNENFWEQSNVSIVYGHIPKLPQISEFKGILGNVESKLEGDVEVEITNECDVPVSRFGFKLWELLASNNTALSKFISDSTKIKNISYTDAYVSSPWSFILFLSMINGLKQKLNTSWNKPVIHLHTGDKDINPRAKGLYAEWSSKQVQAGVFKDVFHKLGDNLDVEFSQIKDMPHSRSLIIEWETGDVTTVRFDHGMGFWSIDSRRKLWFDVNDSKDKQINDLIIAMKETRTKAGREFPTQIFIKNRR